MFLIDGDGHAPPSKDWKGWENGAPIKAGSRARLRAVGDMASPLASLLRR